MKVFRVLLLIPLGIGLFVQPCAGQNDPSHPTVNLTTPSEEMAQECDADYHRCLVDFDQRAKGKSETVLAGIDVYHGDIHAITAKFGKPNHFEDKPVVGCLQCGGERSYIWEQGGWTLHVVTDYSVDEKTHLKSESEPTTITVEGTSEGSASVKTGKGLSLGDTESALKRIYGPRFIEGTNSATKNHYVTLQWQDGTTMWVDFDSSAKIFRIEIAAFRD